MAENPYKNKIVYDGDTLIDLTEDTVTPNTLLAGTTAHDRSGAPVTGTYTAPVTSVNGQTGDVTLDATDIGALPDTTAIPTKTSDLENDSNFMSGMTILAYGKSTWSDFITAYTAKHVVYCRASSASNPASGSQTRMAFMAYVNNAESPTEVEFQYYRSVSSHNVTQQGDQVYVYKLTSSGKWSVIVRENYTRIVAGTNMTSSYSGGVLTLNSSGGGSSSVTEVTISTSGAVSQALDAGTIYHFTGSVSSLSLTLNAAASGQLAQYHFDFESGSTPATVTITGVTWPGGSFVPEANTRYECDILNGYGVWLAW